MRCTAVFGFDDNCAVLISSSLRIVDQDNKLKTVTLYSNFILGGLRVSASATPIRYDSRFYSNER